MIPCALALALAGRMNCVCVCVVGGGIGFRATSGEDELAGSEGTRGAGSVDAPPTIVICPGFGNAMVDYVAPLGSLERDGLCAVLARRGYATSVLPVDRRDWLRVALGLRDWSFVRGRGVPTGPAFNWYLQLLRESVEAEAARSNSRVLLLAHSAGGWLARAALADNEWRGDGRTSDSLVRGLVTLGSPHLPPPDGLRDQTFGTLRFVDAAYPGAHLRGSIGYVTVASDAIVGNPAAERGSPSKYAFGSYEMVCGAGGVPGDGVVPSCSAHLEGALLQLTLEQAVHSINEPGTAQPTARWYGSEAVIDQWLAPVEQVLGLPQRAPAQESSSPLGVLL